MLPTACALYACPASESEEGASKALSVRPVPVGRPPEGSRVLVRMRKRKFLHDIVLSYKGNFFLLELKSISN